MARKKYDLNTMKQDTVAERILYLRIKNKLQQQDVAKSTGIPIDSYRNLEYGTPPRADDIIALSEFYNVTTDYILCNHNLESFDRIDSLLSKYSKNRKEKILKLIEAVLDLLASSGFWTGV